MKFQTGALARSLRGAAAAGDVSLSFFFYGKSRARCDVGPDPPPSRNNRLSSQATFEFVDGARPWAQDVDKMLKHFFGEGPYFGW